MTVNVWKPVNLWLAGDIEIIAATGIYYYNGIVASVVVAPLWQDKEQAVTNWGDKAKVTTIWSDK